MFNVSIFKMSPGGAGGGAGAEGPSSPLTVFFRIFAACAAKGLRDADGAGGVGGAPSPGAGGAVGGPPPPGSGGGGACLEMSWVDHFMNRNAIGKCILQAIQTLLNAWNFDSKQNS
jgi:hypothetical protein